MHEGDLLDWLSVAAVGAAALAAAANAVAARRTRGRFSFLAVALTFLTVDDAVGLHERVTAAAAGAWHLGTHGDAAFVVAYLPLLAGGFAVMWAAARDAATDAARALFMGLALIAFALSVRVAGALLYAAGVGPSDSERTVGLGSMHGAEIAGWALVATGLGWTALRSARARSA